MVRNRVRIAALLVFAVLAPSSAQAARIIEFQLQADRLFELVNDRIHEEHICATAQFELPGQNGNFVLDHIEFPGGMEMERNNGQLQIAVPALLFTKRPSCLSDPDCGQTEYTPAQPRSITLLLDLTAEPDGSKVELCAALTGLKYGAIPMSLDSLDPGLTAAVQNFVDPMCSSVEVLKPIKQAIGGKPKIKAAGASANENFSRLAIRVELENPANPTGPLDPGWGAFFNGGIKPHGPGMEWSLFIDKDFFVETVVSRFSSSLTGNEEFTVTSGPTGSWAANHQGGGHVYVTMSGEVDVDGCLNTIGVDPANVTIDFHVDAATPNVIKTHGSLDTDVVDSDVFLCAWLWGQASGGLPIILTTLSVIAANQGPSDEDFPSECVVSEDGETFDCDRPLEMQPIKMSKWSQFPWATKAELPLNALYGHDQGPILGGPIEIDFAVLAGYYKTLEVTPGEFYYGILGGCSSLTTGYDCKVELEGTGRVCGSIQVLSDPNGVFGVAMIDSGSSQDLDDAKIIFPKFGGNVQAYFADPYPCKLRIRTSVGLKCIEIAPPPPPPEPGTPAYWDIQTELIRAKADCKKEIVFVPGQFNPRWHIDPPPFDLPVDLELNDPFVIDSGIVARVHDLSIEALAPIEAVETGAGRFQLPAIQTAINFTLTLSGPLTQGGLGGGVAGGPLTPGVAGRSASAGGGSAQPRDAVGEMNVEVDVVAPVTLDLAAEMTGDGSRAMLKAAADTWRMIYVPEHQLPEGVRSMSFVIWLDPSRLGFEGELVPMPEETESDRPDEDAEDTSEADAIDEACGAGVCGVGTAGFAPLMLLAWFLLRSSPRRVRRERSRSARARDR